MTLILTVLTGRYAIQASDRRTTYEATGEVASDSRNKVFAMVCADMRFTLSYTGVANINESRMDQWLTDVIIEEKMTAMTGDRVLLALRKRLTEKFSSEQPLRLVIAGFLFDGRPNCTYISNYDDEIGPTAQFEIKGILCKVGENPFIFAFDGMEQTFESQRADVDRLRDEGFFLVSDPKSICDRLAAMAAADEQHGHYVGEDVSCVVVPADCGESMSSHFYRGSSKRQTNIHDAPLDGYHPIPGLMTERVSMMDGYVWTGSEPPPWFKDPSKRPPGWRGPYGRQSDE
jgi:hypothetical protein